MFMIGVLTTLPAPYQLVRVYCFHIKQLSPAVSLFYRLKLENIKEQQYLVMKFTILTKSKTNYKMVFFEQIMEITKRQIWEASYAMVKVIRLRQTQI